MRLAEFQRSRLLRAAVEVASERGYEGMSVAAIVARARVSRKTFYELFQSRDDCFLAVLEETFGHMARVAAPAYEGERRPSRRLRAALAVLLEHLEGERDTGTLAVAYLLGAGPKHPERRARVLDTLRGVVEDGHSHAKPTHKPSPLAAEVLVGGALAIIHARLQTGQGHLITLANPLMSMIVQPYLGPAAAAKELRRTPPKPAETPPEPARTPPEPAGTPPKPPRNPVKDLGIPVTYRTARVMAVIAIAPGLSNAEISARAGIKDQGQISRLLARLAGLELIENTGGGQAKGAPNAWRLTRTGKEVESAIRRQSATNGR